MAASRRAGRAPIKGKKTQQSTERLSMRRAGVAVLALVSSSALAGWVEVSDTDRFITFADPATISKSGDTVKMWDLLDYRKIREVEGVRYLSQKSESEYDCKKARTRPLVMFLHLGMMGSGQTVFTSTTPDPWQRVEPGSVNEALMKYACAQR
jgi:hypothetical protein